MDKKHLAQIEAKLLIETLIERDPNVALRETEFENPDEADQFSNCG